MLEREGEGVQVLEVGGGVSGQGSGRVLKGNWSKSTPTFCVCVVCVVSDGFDHYHLSRLHCPTINLLWI